MQALVLTEPCNQQMLAWLKNGPIPVALLTESLHLISKGVHVILNKDQIQVVEFQSRLETVAQGHLVIWSECPFQLRKGLIWPLIDFDTPKLRFRLAFCALDPDSRSFEFLHGLELDGKQLVISRVLMDRQLSDMFFETLQKAKAQL